ncbi:hypothetical protein F0U60_10385 [Archangium minus]|uniref:Lipoprotein n=1 Tax=Archangium minus TaxID=83450 RepID=A0ABY9WNT8_9BACT|nr:hypothetical protein F0U60_10385 [Archangium minus]
MALAFGLLAAGCEPSASPPAQVPSAPHPAGEVVREWHPRPLEDPSTTPSAVGEPCANHGAAECASGLCVRTATGTRLCSRTCAASSDCPEGWGCVAAVPGGAEQFCLPRPARR